MITASAMSNLKSYMREQLVATAKYFRADCEALSDERFVQRPAPSARSPIDLAYEVAVINQRIAKRLKHEDPGPFEFTGWVTAPDGYRSKAQAMADFDASVQALLDAWDAIPDEQIWDPVPISGGDSPGVDMVFFCIYHMGYHDGQLNYIQTLGGDELMHWSD